MNKKRQYTEKEMNYIIDTHNLLAQIKTLRHIKAIIDFNLKGKKEQLTELKQNYNKGV